MEIVGGKWTFSVNKDRGDCMTQKQPGKDDIPLLDKPVSDSDLLGMKLQQEIEHFEQWLESQRRENRAPERSIAPTIQELIKTRRRLLESLKKSIDSGTVASVD